MKTWTRLPLRVRLTAVFVAGTALVLGAVGSFVYVRSGADLLEASDAGTRSRAEILAANVRARGPALADVGSALIERDEAFAQLAEPSGAIFQSSPIVNDTPLLPAEVIRSVTRPEFFDRHIPGIDNVTRVLAVPVNATGHRVVLLVGSSLQDRRDQLIQLAATLAIGGPVALFVISWAGWLLAGAALRPVERMRREADAISTADPDLRLSLPPAHDEIARLGVTLNAMLDRIQGSFDRERRFLDNASHELRMPLAVLRAELDLALSRARSTDELEAALRSASEETEHLSRLAEDLLVLARAQGGRLPVRREQTSLEGFLGAIAKHFEPRASAAGIRLEATADEASASIDPVRVRQALDDLLDNALRHTPTGGLIRLSAVRDDGAIRVAVADSGTGFAQEFLPAAFDPFTRDPSSRADDGAGIGLAIVRAVCEAHGGTASAENRTEGGAVVTMVLPDQP